jgi:uncharacterized protein YpmB
LDFISSAPIREKRVTGLLIIILLIIIIVQLAVINHKVSKSAAQYKADKVQEAMERDKLRELK